MKKKKHIYNFSNSFLDLIINHHQPIIIITIMFIEYLLCARHYLIYIHLIHLILILWIRKVRPYASRSIEIGI